MDIDSIRTLLSEVALAPPKADDREELQAMRKISIALAQMAEGIMEVRRIQAAMIARSRSLRRSALRKRR